MTAAHAATKPAPSTDPAYDLLSIFDRLDWYRRCLEDIQDGRVVRGLSEAKAGWDSAADELRALACGGAR